MRRENEMETVSLKNVLLPNNIQMMLNFQVYPLYSVEIGFGCKIARQPIFFYPPVFDSVWWQ